MTSSSLRQGSSGQGGYSRHRNTDICVSVSELLQPVAVCKYNGMAELILKDLSPERLSSRLSQRSVFIYWLRPAGGHMQFPMDVYSAIKCRIYAQLNNTTVSMLCAPRQPRTPPTRRQEAQHSANYNATHVPAVTGPQSHIGVSQPRQNGGNINIVARTMSR